MNNVDNLTCTLNKFNVNGTHLMSVPLEFGINEIHMDKFLPGYYPYTITNKNELLTSGRWIQPGVH